jgi:TonB family protein
MSFGNSLFISCAFHLALLWPVLNLEQAPKEPNAEIRPLVVDYVEIREKVKAPEEPKLELNKRIEMKAPVDANQDQAKRMSEIVRAREAAKKEARVRSTKDYINYYQLIREKIRARVKAKYTAYYKEGDVSLVFILRADGSLTKVEVEAANSIPDKTLQDIAVASVKEAAPFAPFPKALFLPAMSFNLVVSFKKHQ